LKTPPKVGFTHTNPPRNVFPRGASPPLITPKIWENPPYFGGVSKRGFHPLFTLKGRWAGKDMKRGGAKTYKRYIKGLTLIGWVLGGTAILTLNKVGGGEKDLGEYAKIISEGENKP
jgi:hypothetical protein